VRVHEEILKRQQLPPELVGKKIWEERFVDITHFEDYLTRQGTIVLKFFLNLSREEQKMRFLKRLERPEKNWKLSASDVHERKFWDDYGDCHVNLAPAERESKGSALVQAAVAARQF
jgi:polyphosphate kinase 2 (PPK2 family)